MRIVSINLIFLLLLLCCWPSVINCEEDTGDTLAERVRSYVTGGSSSKEYYQRANDILAQLPKGPPGQFERQSNIHSRKPGFFQILDKFDEWLSSIEGGHPDEIYTDYHDEEQGQHEKQEQQIIANETISALHTDGFDLLEKSANLGSKEALRLLGDSYFYGNFSTQRNFSKALGYYHQLASLGDTEGQFMCGLYYSTGLFGTVDPDQARATLYYTVAAENGNVRAKLAMAHRHGLGIAGTVDWKKAFLYYLSAAKDAYDYVYPLGDQPFTDRFPGRDGSWLLPNHEQGGVYGKFSSRTSLAAESFSGTQLEEIFDILHYSITDYNLEEAVMAFHHLAVLYRNGLRSIDPDWKLSASFAREGARKVWTEGGDYQSGIHKSRAIIEHGGQCAMLLGHYYLKGEGVAQDIQEGVKWIQRGAKLNHPGCKNTLGKLHLYGIGIEKDSEKAIGLIRESSTDGSHEGRLSLGKLFISNNKVEEGKKMISLSAAAHSDNLEANYLSVLFKREQCEADNWVYQENLKSACQQAKKFVERVQDLHSPLLWAQSRYREGDYENAILGFLIAAEEGYYSGELNLAYILDDQGGYFDIRTEKAKKLHSFDKGLETALVYWGRAARQSHDPAQSAMLKVGDYYYYGKGIQRDPAKAFACYYSASSLINGMANWNIGWMYEHGIGVEKDYNLAKRFYDLSLLSHRPPRIAIGLSLALLYLKSFWNDATGGKVKSVLGETTSKLPFKEALQKLWGIWKDEALVTYEHQQQDFSAAEENYSLESPAYFYITTVVLVFSAFVYLRSRLPYVLRYLLGIPAIQNRIRQARERAREREQQQQQQQQQQQEQEQR